MFQHTTCFSYCPSRVHNTHTQLMLDETGEQNKGKSCTNHWHLWGFEPTGTPPMLHVSVRPWPLGDRWGSDRVHRGRAEDPRVLDLHPPAVHGCRQECRPPGARGTRARLFPSLPLMPPAWTSSAEAGPAPGAPMSHLRRPRGPRAPTPVPLGPGRCRPHAWRETGQEDTVGGSPIGEGNPRAGLPPVRGASPSAHLSPRQLVRPQRGSGLGQDTGRGGGSESG